jgi:hypothetical protein
MNLSSACTPTLGFPFNGRTAMLAAMCAILCAASAARAATTLGPVEDVHDRTPGKAEIIQACEAALPPESVDIEQSVAPLTYSTDATSAELTAEDSNAPSGSHLVGRTYATFNAPFNLTLHWVQLGRFPGVNCMRVTATGRVALTAFRVAVAREFPAGTCAFNHILAHEKRHVGVDEETVQSATTTLRDELNKYLRGKIFFGTPSVLGPQLKAQLTEYWTTRSTVLINLGLSQHRLIDTPEEYARNKTVCGGALAQTLDGDFAE